LREKKYEGELQNSEKEKKLEKCKEGKGQKDKIRPVE
jgi:hypothetical protein